MLNIQPIDRTLHALAEPTRRAMIERLSGAELSVSELAKPFDMTLAAVMQHLAVLEACGLVETRKAGRVRTCRMRSAGFAPLESWLNARRTLWERRLDRLGEVLNERRRT
jgi:DNA-binding transcriptional ArsR family regulator